MLEIIPAIDLRGGRCVRLYQGDFSRETVFAENPVWVARHWQRLGARRLHVVDLDGARAGRPIQLDAIAAIAGSVGIPIELGGGLRSIADVEAALRAGVDRVVLGTAAIGQGAGSGAAVFRRACREAFAERVVIGLDTRDGQLALKGWAETTRLDVFVFAAQLRREGFARIIYTDISRDGALKGPNLEHISRLAAVEGLAVIASGGIRSVADLRAVADAGVEAAIVGQALYTGALDLAEAVTQLGIPPGQVIPAC